MKNIGLIISYEGTAYYGFQTQPGNNTIQDKIEYAIYRFTGERVKIVSSGRTDAGVHARRQWINFQTASVIPIERWRLALNSLLPKDIVILQARFMPLAFHSRRFTKRKTYRYTINCNRTPDVFQRNFQLHHPTKLNVGDMNNAIQVLEGKHDFSSFCSAKSTKESHVRIIYEASVIHQVVYNELDEGQGIVHIVVTGNGFLYNMVRIIVGTLLQVGEGKRQPDDMAAILEARSRAAAGPTAPSVGLVLWDVVY